MRAAIAFLLGAAFAGSVCAADPDGWRFGDVCYPTQLEAAQAMCASQVGVLYAGTTAYTWTCRSVATMVNDRVLMTLERATVCTPAPCFPTQTTYGAWGALQRCVQAEINPPSDSEQVAASLAIWGAGLGALALVWAGRKVYEHLMHGRREV